VTRTCDGATSSGGPAAPRISQDAMAHHFVAARSGVDECARCGMPVANRWHDPDRPRAAWLHPQPPPPTWARLDLTAHLDGTHVPQIPEVLERTDGQRLLYRGRVHSLHGESESGKSWVALAAVAAELNAGGRVLMLDFESDAATVVGRLLLLAVPAAALAERFDYRRPEADPAATPSELVSWEQLLRQSYSLVVLDGVTEALAVFGVSSKDNDEVTAWVRGTPRRLASTTGAAVVLVDHVTKDAYTRGRFAIGGQAKMAALDGAAYVVEIINPLGVGLLGRVALRVAKDRPGGVRPHAGAWRKGDRTQEAAVVTIDSREAGRTIVTVDPPRTGQLDLAGASPAPRPASRPTELMTRVSQTLELAGGAMSRSNLAAAVGGRRQYALEAIDLMLADGYLADDGPRLNGGRPSVRFVRPYETATTQS
jgi:hypothetical protein